MCSYLPRRVYILRLTITAAARRGPPPGCSFGQSPVIALIGGAEEKERKRGGEEEMRSGYEEEGRRGGEKERRRGGGEKSRTGGEDGKMKKGRVSDD